MADSHLNELIAFIMNRRFFAQNDYDRDRYNDVLEQLHRLKDLER